MREWARLYQAPLWLTTVFVALLILFAVTPDPSQSAADVGANPTSEPTPGPHECVICSIDKTCDPKTGRCVFLDATPLPCVKGSKFDNKAGFCLPTGAPTIPPELLQTPEESFDPFASDEPRETPLIETPEPSPNESGGPFETEPPVTPEP